MQAMEETTNQEINNGFFEEEEESMFNWQNLVSLVILNVKWFIFSVFLFIGGAYAYLRYTTPVYQATTKMLIKSDGDGRSARRSIRNAENLGMISNSEGIENEMEILASHSIAEDVVKKLKLYTTYREEGRIVDRYLYKNQPLSVDLDEQSLDNLKNPISLSVTFSNGKYIVKGSYSAVINAEKGSEPREINATLPAVPARIRTAVGYLIFQSNGYTRMKNDETLFVTIAPVAMAANSYIGKLRLEPTGKSTSIVRLTMTDTNIQRALDYLGQIVHSYNEEANNDKNEIAHRTDEFINERLGKIMSELGSTEGQIESFKRSNNVADVSMKAGNAFSQTSNYDQQLAEMGAQVTILEGIGAALDDPSNRYQTLPAISGLTSDQTASSLINNYNEIALQRQRLLRTANENSPSVIPLTEQLNDISSSIRRSIAQTRKNFEIKRSSMLNQYSKYNAQVQQSPTQERYLKQIGRDAEVRSSLYLMLLQKREENSISLAATADKGKIIDAPAFAGQIAPNKNQILLIALGLSLIIPFLILLFIQMMKYKIEGRGDVERLTKLPVLADIPVASETAKTKADIVVHENQNNMMEEVFRSLRTNLQFTLKENEKVILITSTTSGEGKTFIAANVAVCFALLGKKVALVGLDIRKPRLSELFGIENNQSGITNILTHDSPTKEMVLEQITPSGIVDKLDLLMAGPIPPNPAEIIARESLDKTFDILREEYDYVIIDTAPVGLVTDTISIGRVANATVFVCRADYTPKAAFSYFNELAASGKMPNPSITINAVDLSKKKYGYYYGYGKYGKYGKYASYKRYGGYGKYGGYGRYGGYGKYGTYGSSYYGHYGNYSQSHYGNANDTSIKK